jgi:MarR family transcriptional regulator, lower aerobic nicotinate degradation pathway regulator
MKTFRNLVLGVTPKQEQNSLPRGRRSTFAPKRGLASKVTLDGPLYEKPGFLLWRVRHIANSIFTYECREFDVTPPQYLVLAVVKEIPGTDQAGVSRTAGLDRFTTGLVLSNLIKRGLIIRERSAKDRRSYALRLSPHGLELLKRIIPGVARSRARFFSPFTPREQRVFIGMLQKLATMLNNDARAPVHEDALPYARRHSGRTSKK